MTKWLPGLDSLQDLGCGCCCCFFFLFIILFSLFFPSTFSFFLLFFSYLIHSSSLVIRSSILLLHFIFSLFFIFSSLFSFFLTFHLSLRLLLFTSSALLFPYSSFFQGIHIILSTSSFRDGKSSKAAHVCLVNGFRVISVFLTMS